MKEYQEYVFPALTEKCQAFADDTAKQQAGELGDNMLFRWQSFFVNSGYPDLAVQFTELSPKCTDKDLNRLEKFIAEHGYVETMLGRRRYAKDLSEGGSGGARRDANYVKRALINTTIQGSAAEIIKLAMVNVMNKFESSGLFAKPSISVPSISAIENANDCFPDNRGLARLVLQVHDELVFEVHESVVSEVKQMIVAGMEGAVKLKVPLKVGIEIGTTW